MRLVAIATVGLTVFAGCLFSGGPCTSGLMGWAEAGLYAALPGAAGRNGAEYREIPPPTRLPFEDEAAARRWPGYALKSVGWELDRLPRQREGPRMSLYVPDENTSPTFSLTASAETSQDGLRELFNGFVQNVTTADSSRVDQWFEDLLKTRKDAVIQNRGSADGHVVAYSYTVTMAGPFRLKEFFEEM
ncbi:MAG TPA: hypothetical protein VGB18_06915, partial [Candidatus Thermoplasmatota archaeon]